MFSQGVALVALIFAQSFTHFIIIASILGLGTALVYPTFLATVAENTNPSDRAHSVGIFRLWRDMGYAIGAILTGIIADFFGMPTSILIIGLLTIIAALIIQIRMKCGGTNSVKVLQWLVNKMTLSTDS
jgi:MFS family permease